mmetsp:Transcript_9859/g.26841  ORF Transcript_9859/g.26841 Transcript_9859/m.26841 type:complete len:236 (-) Transcript_9859:919-1626(-)
MNRSSSRCLLASTMTASALASSLYSAHRSAISSVLPRLESVRSATPFCLDLFESEATMSPPRMSIASLSRHSNAHSISNCKVLIASSRDTIVTCSSSCRSSDAIFALLGMSVLRTLFSRILLASCSFDSSATMISFRYLTISESFPVASMIGREIWFWKASAAELPPVCPFNRFHRSWNPSITLEFVVKDSPAVSRTLERFFDTDRSRFFSPCPPASKFPAMPSSSPPIPSSSIV